MKRTFTLPLLAAAFLFTAAAATPHNYTVSVSYYGDGSDFDISYQIPQQLMKGDTVTVVSSDPGQLVLQLDDKTLLTGRGSITLTREQMMSTKLVRCSMLLDDGSLVGWAAGNDSAGFPDPTKGNVQTRPRQNSWFGRLHDWVASLFTL